HAGGRRAAADGAVVDDDDRMAIAGQGSGAGGADDPGADDDDPPAVHARMPRPKGSASSIRSVASAVTNARPRTSGITPPSPTVPRAATRLPMTLSWRHHCPSASLPSAIRQATLALVPVPHGERSYALPGQRTKLRASASAPPGEPKSSMWSISPP